MGRWLLLLAVAALPIAVYAWRSSDDAGAEGNTRRTATNTDPEAANLYHLYVMPLSGGRADSIPDPRANPYLTFSPAWSPNGDRMAVTEIDCHNCAPEIRVIDLEQERPNRRKLGGGSQPTFAPDGSTLAYVPSGGGLATISVDGGNRRVLLTEEMGSVNRPRFSPDGQRIAFMRQDRRGRWHVWTIRPNGAAPRQLTKGARPEADPAWSSDGKLIAFARQAQNGLWHIFVVPRGGGPLRRITGLGTSDSHPSFTPDGKSIVFVRQRGSRFSLVHQSLAGGGRELRTAPLRDAAEPAVSPTGDELAFVARR
jgi:Tol biopolymer transport system component